MVKLYYYISNIKIFFKIIEIIDYVFWLNISILQQNIFRSKCVCIHLFWLARITQTETKNNN